MPKIVVSVKSSNERLSRRLIRAIHKPVPQRLVGVTRVAGPLNSARPALVAHPIGNEIMRARVYEHFDAAIEQRGGVELVLMQCVARVPEGEV